MPIVTFVLRDIWTPFEVHGISEAVHEALVEAFRIPKHVHNQPVVLHEQPLENWGRGGRSAAVAPPSFRLDV